MHGKTLHGAGLGLRREHVPVLMAGIPDAIDFFEVAPENWLDMGGSRRKELDYLAEQRPIAAHGLSLNLGGQTALDEVFLHRLKWFMDRYHITFFSEHLSWCADDGHLYDLLPLPFTYEAVRHVAMRIRRTEDVLERRIAVENASFYLAAPMNDMSEPEFIRAVLDEADCDLHLDVNNVYVNSVNFGFDPHVYLDQLPIGRTVYIHTAGHLREADDLIIDTHGDSVTKPVWDLLEHTYARFGTPPTLLERDLNIPPLDDLLPEVERIRAIQASHREQRHVA